MPADVPVGAVPRPAGFYVRLSASAVILLGAWGSLLLLIWNLDRGFDLTDESFLLYLYRHPDSFLDHLYFQHFRLVRSLLPSSLDHAYDYRLLKLTGLLAFTGLFSGVLVKWTAHRFPFLAKYSLSPILLFHFLLVGSFLAYCHGSHTLSYNDLVTLCLLGVATACFALDLTPSGVNTVIWKFSISLVVGGLLILLFPIKWSSAVLLAGYYLAFTCLITADRRRDALLASLGGAMCGAALLIFTMTDVGVGTIFSFSRLFSVLSHPEHLGSHDSISGLLAAYVEGISRRFMELLRSPSVIAVLVLPIVAIVVSARSNGRPAWRLVLKGLVVAALVSLAVFAGRVPGWAWDHRYWFHRSAIADLQTFAFVFAWIGAGCCLSVMRSAIPHRDLIAFMGAAGLLATLPAVGSIGTDNPLLTQFIRHMAPLFAALAVTAAFLGLAGRWRSFAPVVCATVAGLSAVQLAFVVLLYPYRLPRPGVSQTIELTAPRHMAGLKVDAATKAFIERLLQESTQAVGDTTGMPMLAMFDIPGVVYILDGVSVGHPWHSGNPKLARTVCHRIETDPRSRSGLRLIALDRDDISPSMRECLRRAGIDLSAYVEVARIPNPYPVTAERPLRLLVKKEKL